MNNARRKELRLAISKIEILEGEITAVSEEEQECYQNLPEGIQDGERGEKMDENCQELDEIVSELEDLRNRIEEIIN